MSDDTAVKWSNYEEFRSRVEYETRNKISEKIQRKINIVKESQISKDLYIGLEIANAIVLGTLNDEPLDGLTEEPTL